MKRDLIGVSSVAGVVFRGSEVLLILRRDVPVWVLPGGGIESNESPEEAVVREIYEETGFQVQIKRLVGDYLPLNRLARRTFLYECEIVKGEIKESFESREVRFFSLKELPKMPPPYETWIEEAAQKGPPLQRALSEITYQRLFSYLLSHPGLVIRFLMARWGFPMNR